MSQSLESISIDHGISLIEEPESSYAAWSIDDLVESSDLESLRSARAYTDEHFG